MLLLKINYQRQNKFVTPFNCEWTCLINKVEKYICRALDKREYLVIIRDNFCINSAQKKHMLRPLIWTVSTTYNILPCWRNSKRYPYYASCPGARTTPVSNIFSWFQRCSSHWSSTLLCCEPSVDPSHLEDADIGPKHIAITKTLDSPVLQIRRSNRDNQGIISHISP